MIELLKDNINNAFELNVVEIVDTGIQPTLMVEPAYLKSLCFWLRDHKDYYYDFLANITAIDYFPEQQFGLVYNLTSIPYQTQLTLKVILNNARNLSELPEIDSVSAVWRTADWHEREAFDLMGIFFREHPDLRRILLPDDWEGFPLRKDYMEAESYHGIAIKG